MTFDGFHLIELANKAVDQVRRRKVAEAELRGWYSWARRCRPEPFKRLALTIKDHWQGILNAFDSHLSNGAVEGMNGLPQGGQRLVPVDTGGVVP